MGYRDTIQENSYGHRSKLLFFMARIELLRGRLGIMPEAVDLLDIGCGNAMAVTLPLGERGYSIHAIDMHEPSIRHAESVNTLENVRFIVGDASALENESRFDVVLLSDVLEHLHEPGSVLTQVHRMLKPHGIVLISIPNGFGPFEAESYLYRRRFVRSLWDRSRRMLSQPPNRPAQNTRDLAEIPYNEESGHVQFFSLSRIKALLRKTGFCMRTFEKGSLVCGPFSDPFLRRIPGAIRMNLRLGRCVPFFLCSVWLFECKVTDLEDDAG